MATLTHNIVAAESTVATYRGKPQRGFCRSTITCWDGDADIILAQEDFDDWHNREHVFVAMLKDDGSHVGFWAETRQFTIGVPVDFTPSVPDYERAAMEAAYDRIEFPDAHD